MTVAFRESNAVDIVGLKSFLRAKLEANPLLSRLEEMTRNGTSTAGRRHEEVFTREFLSPSISDFFYKHVRPELNLTDAQIAEGLGAEGYKNCHGFGFTPARKLKHLFTKSDVIEDSAPTAWRVAEIGGLPGYHACPDFAITSPLPFSLVGEVKYFKLNSPESGVRELYNVSRQAVFYLGAFHGTYRSAIIVVVDASSNHSFFEALKLVKPELLERFGSETDIHLLPIKLT